MIRDWEPGGVYSPFDIFMKMLYQDQFILMVRLKNLNIYSGTDNNNDFTTPGELLKLVGFLILKTWADFETCASLWNTQSIGKWLRLLCFVYTGMFGDIFFILWLSVILNDKEK